MSLPGLELGEPAAAGTQLAPAAPIQHSLPKGSEWRFEVGVGSTVRVKVCFFVNCSVSSLEMMRERNERRSGEACLWIENMNTDICSFVLAVFSCYCEDSIPP